MSDFKSLKKNRKQQLEQLQDDLEKAAGGKKDYKDGRFWKLPVDSNDNGYAIIRFLPSKGNDTPFIKYFDYGFKGPGGWYIEKSRQSIGQDDPVNTLYWELMNSGRKDEAKKYKRRVHYVANIEVIKSPKSPEDEGKVFLFDFGQKIFDKLVEASTPPFDDQGHTPEHPDYDPTNAIHPFSMWGDGAHFKLTSRRLNGFRNYDASEFLPCEPLRDNDKDLEAIYDQTYNVGEFTEETSYKSENELKAKLAKVLQSSSSSRSDDKEEDAPQGKTSPAAFDEELNNGGDDDDFNLDEFINEIDSNKEVA